MFHELCILPFDFVERARFDFGDDLAHTLDIFGHAVKSLLAHDIAIAHVHPLAQTRDEPPASIHDDERPLHRVVERDGDAVDRLRQIQLLQHALYEMVDPDKTTMPPRLGRLASGPNALKM